MPARITSRSNPHLKRARLLAAEPAARRQERTFIAEGIKLMEEALAAGAELEQAFHSPRLALTERGRALLARLGESRVPLIETSDRALDSVSAAETSQGILGLVRQPPATDAAGAATKTCFWVVCWGLQDPGNLGTLMRTADGAGADLFITVAGSADPTSPKSVRASAGSIFRMPLVRGLPPDEVLETAASRGVRLFGTAPAGGVSYLEPDYAGPIGFAFGREGEGLPPAVTELLHETVSIPMRAGVESLNVAAAAAVVLFEAARRRRPA